MMSAKYFEYYTIILRGPFFLLDMLYKVLRKRSKLMRKGFIDAADSLTARIGERIITDNKTAFHNFRSGSREMWSLVRTVTGKEQRKQQLSKDLAVDDLTSTFLLYQQILIMRSHL